MSNSWHKASIREKLADEFPGAWGNSPNSDRGNALALRSTNIDDVGNIEYRTGAERVLSESKLEAKALQTGDIILEGSGGGKDKPVGRVALFENPGDGRTYVCSNFFRTLRPSSKVNNRFLFWRLLHYWRQPAVWAHQQQTTSIINLKHKHYLATEFEWPPLPEQRRIADVLDTVDAAIRETDDVIAKQEQVKTGLLQDLLTRGLDANGRLRDPEANPGAFRDTELGHFPVSWKLLNLGDLAIHVSSGSTPKGGKKVYQEEGIPFIRSQNVWMNGLNLEDIARIPREIHEAMDRTHLHSHDVLLNITGASIGRCCLVPASLGEANVNQHVCIIRLPKANRTDAAYLTRVLASHIGQSQIDSMQAGGSREGLNYTQIRSFSIPWPGLQERSRIINRLDTARDKQSAERICNAKLQRLKTGLMQDLLTGRVRVPEAESHINQVIT